MQERKLYLFDCEKKAAWFKQTIESKHRYEGRVRLFPTGGMTAVSVRPVSDTERQDIDLRASQVGG